MFLSGPWKSKDITHLFLWFNHFLLIDISWWNISLIKIFYVSIMIYFCKVSPEHNFWHHIEFLWCGWNVILVKFELGHRVTNIKPTADISYIWKQGKGYDSFQTRLNLFGKILLLNYNNISIRSQGIRKWHIFHWYLLENMISRKHHWSS